MSEQPDALQQYLDVKRGDNATTVEHDEKVVGYFNEWLESEGRGALLSVESRDIVAFLHEQYENGGRHGNGLASSTVSQYHTSLRRFYDEFTDDGTVMLDLDESELYEQSPADFPTDEYVDISSRAEKQRYADNDEGIIYLTTEETRKLREAVPKPKVRNELLVKLMVQTGPRASEIARLRLADVDRDRQTVTYEDTKNDKTRTVPYQDLSPEIDLWLEDGYRDRFSVAEDSPFLFVSRKNEQLSASRIGHIIRDAASDAGIQEVMGVDGNGNKRKRVTPHTLRATFIMRCFDAGLPLPKVRKFTGHDSIETLRSYINAGQTDAEDAYHDANIVFES